MILQAPAQDTHDLPSAKDQNVQDIVTYLERNYDRDLTLDDLEKELHLSKFYMTKIFKEVTGTTIFQYLYHLRVNQAKIKLLSKQRLKIIDICHQTGFKHPAHFSRVFKQLVGCTPNEYRSLHGR